jgi:hypothetical protein
MDTLLEKVCYAAISIRGCGNMPWNVWSRILTKRLPILRRRGPTKEYSNGYARETSEKLCT